MTITPGHRCPQHDSGLSMRCDCGTEPESPLQCIARALATLDWHKPHDDAVISHHEYARAALDALLVYGERMQRIGRVFYDDTTEGQPVLVIPLDADHA